MFGRGEFKKIPVGGAALQRPLKLPSWSPPHFLKAGYATVGWNMSRYFIRLFFRVCDCWLSWIRRVFPEMSYF